MLTFFCLVSILHIFHNKLLMAMIWSSRSVTQIQLFIYRLLHLQDMNYSNYKFTIIVYRYNGRLLSFFKKAFQAAFWKLFLSTTRLLWPTVEFNCMFFYELLYTSMWLIIETIFTLNVYLYNRKGHLLKLFCEHPSDIKMCCVSSWENFPREVVFPFWVLQ